MNSSVINLYPKNTYLHPGITIADEDLAELVNQNLSEAVFRCFVDGRILYVNNAFVKLFDLTDANEVLGKKAKIFYSNESVLNDINRYLKRHKKVFKGDVEFKRLDGGIFFGRLSARLVHKNDETFIDGVIQDISLERKSKIEIQQQAEIQKILLKISSVYLDSDLDEVDEVITKSLYEVGLFLGADRLQVHNYEFNQKKCCVTHEWTSEGIQPSLDEAKEISLDLIQEMVLLHEQDKHLFYPSVPGLKPGPIRDALLAQNINSTLTIPMRLNGDCVGFISLDSIKNFAIEYSESIISMLKLFANMIASISSRAKGHSRLKKLIEQVTIQGKQHKDFSFITSHNVRASVANLVAIVDLMKQEYSKRYVDMLDVTIHRLNDSINNINNILHIDHKELLKRSICDIGQSVSRVLQSLEIVIVDQRLEVENKVPASILLNTLQSYLDNILFQLISNAIRYGTNTNSKRITIKAERLSKRVEISIIDYGHGFDTVKHAHRMFKVGARFDHTKGDGQGLGLYITKQQVDSLDGTIEISSSTSGTIARLTFPII